MQKYFPKTVGLLEQLEKPYYAHLTKEGVEKALKQLFEQDQRKTKSSFNWMQNMLRNMSPAARAEFDKAVMEDAKKRGFIIED